MLPLLPIAMGLARYVPDLVGWLAGDKAENVAQKVVDTAMTVTGAVSPEDALAQIQASSELQIAFQQEANKLIIALAEEDTKRLQAVNRTMRVEAKSEHWMQFSWRPFWGFASAVAFVFVAFLCCMLAFNAIKSGDLTAINAIPLIIGAFSTLFSIPGAILGVTAWQRGKEKRERLKAGGK